MPLSSSPEWEGPVIDPDPATAGSPVTVSVNGTYFLGVNSVLFEMDGVNYSMSGTGDTYSYS
ncbi:MAG: hypothetical protein ACP6KW_06790 [Candidatus Thorarchaeota archaeon]